MIASVIAFAEGLDNAVTAALNTLTVAPLTNQTGVSAGDYTTSPSLNAAYLTFVTRASIDEGWQISNTQSLMQETGFTIQVNVLTGDVGVIYSQPAFNQATGNYDGTNSNLNLSLGAGAPPGDLDTASGWENVGTEHDHPFTGPYPPNTDPTSGLQYAPNSPSPIDVNSANNNNLIGILQTPNGIVYYGPGSGAANGGAPPMCPAPSPSCRP
jgi:hypothetical protein